MILVDDIIPDLQIGKTGDRLSAGMFLLFPLFFDMLGKNIAFRNHGKANFRIFKTFENSSIIGHDLARLRHPLRIFGIKRFNPVVPQIIHQALGSGARAGQNQDSVLFLFILLQVMHQSLEAVVVWRKRSGTD